MIAQINRHKTHPGLDQTPRQQGLRRYLDQVIGRKEFPGSIQVVGSEALARAKKILLTAFQLRSVRDYRSTDKPKSPVQSGRLYGVFATGWPKRAPVVTHTVH